MSEKKPPPRVVGSEALRGLAHPLRMQLLTELWARGSATASQLAAALEESSGATSYHLRQLHKHGFVEEDPEQGTARERVWTPRRGGWNIPVLELREDPASAAAVDLVLQSQLVADQQRLLRTIEIAPSWPEEWREAIVRSESYLVLDPAKVTELFEEMQAVVDRYRDLPPVTGSRRVSVVVNLTPTEHEVGS